MLARGLDPLSTKLSAETVEQVRRVLSKHQKNGIVAAEMGKDQRQFWRVAGR